MKQWLLQTATDDPEDGFCPSKHCLHRKPYSTTRIVHRNKSYSLLLSATFEVYYFIINFFFVGLQNMVATSSSVINSNFKNIYSNVEYKGG